MSKIINLLVSKYSLTLYKRTLALLLAFVMLFNLSSEVFASALQARANIEKMEEVSFQLKQALSEEFAEKNLKEPEVPCNTPQTCYQKALLEYGKAAKDYSDFSNAVIGLYKTFNSFNEYALKEYSKEKATLQAKIDAFNEQVNLLSETAETYNKQTGAYIAWKLQKPLMDQRNILEQEILNKINGSASQTVYERILNNNKVTTEFLKQEDKWEVYANLWQRMAQKYEVLKTEFDELEQKSDKLDKERNLLFKQNEQINNSYNKEVDRILGAEGSIYKITSNTELEGFSNLVNAKLDKMYERYEQTKKNYEQAYEKYLELQLREYKEDLIKFTNTLKSRCLSAQEEYEQRASGESAFNKPWQVLNQEKRVYKECITPVITKNDFSSFTGKRLTYEDFVEMKYQEYYETYVPANHKGWTFDGNRKIWSWKPDISKIAKEKAAKIMALLLISGSLGTQALISMQQEGSQAAALNSRNSSEIELIDLAEPEALPDFIGTNKPDESRGEILSYFDRVERKTQNKQDVLFQIVEVINKQAQKELKAIYNPVMLRVAKGENTEAIISSLGINPSYFKTLIEELLKAEGEDSVSVRQEIAASGKQYSKQYIEALLRSQEEEAKQHRTTGQKAGKASSIALDVLFFWLPSTYISKKMEKEDAAKARNNFINAYPIESSQILQNLLKVHAMYFSSGSQAVEAWNQVAAVAKNKKADKTLAYMWTLAGAMGGETSNTQLSANIREQHRKAVFSAQEERKGEEFSSNLIFLLLIDTAAMLFLGVLSVAVLPSVIAKVCTVSRGLRYLNLEQRIMQRALKNVFSKMDAATLRKYKTALGELENLNNLNLSKSNLSSVKSYVQANREVLKVSRNVMEEALNTAKKGGLFGRSARYEKAIANFESLIKEQKQISEYLTQLNNAAQKGSKIFTEINKTNNLIAKIDVLSQNSALKEYNEALRVYNASLSVDIYGNITQTGNLQSPKKTKELAKIERQITNLSGKLDKVSPETQEFLKAQAKAEQASKKLGKFYNQTEEASSVLARGKVRAKKIKTKKVKVDNNAVNATASPDESRVVGQMNTQLQQKQRNIRNFTLMEDLRIRFALNEPWNLIREGVKGLGFVAGTPKYFIGLTPSLAMTAEAPLLASQSVVEASQAAKAVRTLPRTFSAAKPIMLSNTQTLKTTPLALGALNTNIAGASLNYGGSLLPVGMSALLGNIINFTGFVAYDKRWNFLGLSKQKQKGVAHADAAWWNKATTQAYNEKVNIIQEKVLAKYQQEALALISVQKPLPANANTAMRKVYSEVQAEVNLNTLWWIYGNSVEEVFLPYEKEATSTTGIAAGLFIPMPEWLLGYLTGSKTVSKLSAEDIKKLKGAVTEAFKEASEKYISSYKGAQERINQTTVIQDENFVNILKESIAQKINLVDIRVDSIKKELIANLINRIEKMKDGEVVAVKRASFISTKEALQEYANKYGQEAINNIEQATYLQDKRFVEIFISKLQKNLEKTQLSASRQDQYRQTFAEKLNYVAAKKSKEEISNEAAILKNISAAYGASIDGIKKPGTVVLVNHRGLVLGLMQSPVADDYLDREVNLLREGKTVASGKIVNYDENLGLSVIFIDKADNLQTSYTFATEKLVPNKTLYLNSYSYNNGKSLVQANQFDKQDSKTGFLNLKEAPKQEQTGAAIIDEEGNLYGLASASNNSVDVKSLRPFLTKAVWTILTNTELRNQAMRNYPGFVESYQNIFDAIKAKNISLFHIPGSLFRPAAYVYNVNGREGQVLVNNSDKPAPKQDTKKVEIRTEDQLLVHYELNAMTETIISELEPNATAPNVKKGIKTRVADFKQMLKALYNKVFPKYNSGKLFGLFLPITATFIMQLAKLVQDIKDRIPAMKKAFKNAEERTLNVLLFADNELAKDLFLGYLEEELVLENFSREKIDEFLQITDNYLREQLNTKETIQDNKQSTEVETSQKIQESITFDTMTAEEMIKADPQGIIAELDKALYINNTDSKAYYYRAKAKAELQDYQGALEDFQTAFDLEPSNKKYAKALEEAKAKLQQQIKPNPVSLQDMTVDNFINDMEAQLPANLTQEQTQAIALIRREAQALRRLESLPRVIDKITLLQEALRLTLIAKPVLNVNGSNSETNFDFLKANKEDIIDVAVESNEKANSMLHSHLLPDFYDRFAFYIKTLANSHKEFSIVLNMHGGQKGEILAVEKTTISDILDLIKANSSDSTVNIITTSCHGQAGDSAFADKLLNYGFNYLGITGRNDSFFNSDIQSLFNYDLPTAFVNSITLGYFGAILIYKGKVYRALDIVKEQYKDDADKIKELELLQEYYFGQDPVKAMKELGKMERYTLKYDGIPALRSLENIQSTKKLPNIKPPKEFTQVNRTVVFGYPFALINLEKDKIFLLSAPISKIKTDFLKTSKQVFKGDNINIIQKDLITAKGNYSSNIGAGFFEEIYKAISAFNFNPYFGQVALPFLSSYHNTQDNSFEVHNGQNTSARQPTEEKTKTNTFAQPYTSILAVFRDLSKHSYLYQKPEIPVQNNTNQSISNEGAPVNEVKPQQDLKEEKGFYDDTLEFNLLDQASRLRLSLAGQDIGVSRAQKLFMNMDFNSIEEVRRLYRAFIAEVKLIKNLMALEEKGYENLTEKEKLKFDENFKKTVSIRKALANIVFTLNLSDSFPRDFFEKMRDALMTVDPGARVYFTSKKENKKGSSDVVDKINFYYPDISQDHLYTDISDLVIIVMNDERPIASYIADNLSQYSNNVFKATTIYELKNLLENLKQKGLRPHYFINDMHLGQTVSGSDAMRVVKQTFPEIANNIGFIMWSDSSGLGDYLRENNYIGHVKRVEGENSTSSVKHPAFYLSYIESKEHIADKINQIPLAGQQVPQRIFDQEIWQNFAVKDINEIARLFGINNKEIILVDLSGLIMKPAADKIKQEAQKNGFTIKEVKTLEEIENLDFTDKKLIFGNIFSYEKKDKLFQVKKDSPVIWVDYEDLDLSQKQEFFADGYEGYYYVKREKKINSDNKIRTTNVFKPMATPRVIRRPGNFGGIFMPIILPSFSLYNTDIKNPNAHEYTENWASFATLEPTKIITILNSLNLKSLLVKDKYGKLPVQYALENKYTKGYIKQNDAFNYVYLYSNQVGLTPNTVIDEKTGMTLAMYTLQQEVNNHPFNILSSAVDINILDKQGNTIVKYLIEGVMPLETAEHLFYNLSKEQSAKLLNIKNKEGQGVLFYIDNSGLEPSEKMKLLSFFREKGLLFDESEEALAPALKTTELRDFVDQAIKQTKEGQARAAEIKKAREAFYNPAYTEAVVSKTGSKISMKPLSYVDGTLAAEFISQANDINEINEEGFTSLMYAAQNPNEKIVEMVLKAGGRANITTQAGRALPIAQAANNTKVTKILEKKDRIFRQEQKEKLNNKKKLLNLNPDKTNFLGIKTLLPNKKYLKGLYVSWENAGYIIESLEEIANLRYLKTDSELMVKEEKLLSSIYDDISKDPFSFTPHKVMAVLQGKGQLFILNRGIALKDALSGELVADIHPDVRRHYGVVRIIYNHIPGVLPITKADFMLLPKIVRGEPFFEDEKFKIYHYEQDNGNILKVVFAKINSEDLVIVSMQNISKEEAAKDNIANEELNSFGKGEKTSYAGIINQEIKETALAPVKDVKFATPRVIRRPGNFGSIFMPIILTRNQVKPQGTSSSQTKYTSPYLSFFKQEYDFFDNSRVLDRAIYNLMNSEKNFIREIKWSSSDEAQTNKDKAFYNEEDFVERTKFEQIYNIDNPGDYTILLVQDDKASLARAAEALIEKGFKVVTASDGFTAQTMLKDFKKEGEPLHFLITDNTLPVRDGAELAKFVFQNSMDTIVISFSDSVIDAQNRYKKGFDFSFSIHENETENIANFLPYLIQKYGFKGTPKKKTSGSSSATSASQTYYLEQNPSQIINTPNQQSTQAEQANLTTEIKEDQNPLLFLPNQPATHASLATFLIFAPFIVSNKITSSINKGKTKTRRSHKNIPLYYTKDIKNGEEIPLNLHIQLGPRFEMPAKYDKIIFDKKGIAYYGGPDRTRVISHFYMEVQNKPYDLKLLIGAVRKSKLASPFDIKFTAANYDNKNFSRVLLYDANYNVSNINILSPKDFLKADEGIQFSNGSFYLFNKKTLTRIVKLENIKIRVPKKQIPNLTEVFLNSKSRPTLHFVPNFDKASVVYRTSMFTNVSLGKTFGPIAKRELGVTETSSSGIMLGIQYGIPLLSLAIQPRVRAWGEKKTLLIALALSLAAGTMAALAGFNGILPDVPRTLLQKSVFITAFALMSFSTLLRQLVSTILIGDNSGVVNETDPRATINHKQPSDENTSEEIKTERFSIINLIKRNKKTERNIYSIPLELVLSKAFVFKSIGTLVFLTFPFMLNKLIYWLSFKTMQPNFDYSLSFPLFALVSAIGIIKTYRTNLRDRSPGSSEEDKAKKGKSVKARYQEKVKKAKEKHQNRIKKIKENISKAKSEKERKAWIEENGKIVRYFLTLVFANTHEFVVSSALASELSSIFTDSATSNFYIALGLYAPLLIGRWLFNKVRGKTSSGTSFAVFMGLSLFGTLMMVFNPASQLMLMLGAGIASLGMGNCFTLFYTHVTKQYSKEKELTISSLGSIAVAASALLTMVSPKLIESGHFQASLIYGLAMIVAVTILGLPVMQDSPIMKVLKDVFSVKSDSSDTKPESSFRTKTRNFFSDLGKWWHYPKDGPDMNNPTPQN